MLFISTMLVYFCLIILPLTYEVLFFIQMLLEFVLCYKVMNTVCLFQLLFYIIYSAFNKLASIILHSHCFCF